MEFDVVLRNDRNQQLPLLSTRNKRLVFLFIIIIFSNVS